MRISNVLVALLFAAATFFLWAISNRPTEVVAWPKEIDGFAFSPFRAGQDAITQLMPTRDEIGQDIQLLAGKTKALRTYSSLNSLAHIPALAASHNITIVQGIWLDRNQAINSQELAAGIALARSHANITSVMTGNETILRGEFSVSELTDILDSVRRAVDQPVSTAEPWHVWLDHPEMADHVDFLTVHMLPYWEGVHVDVAVDFIDEKLRLLEDAFPGKPILIGEVGWPSDGRTRGFAIASEANEALFLRRFLQRAHEKNYNYFLMEAFDQPWKAQSEGGVGAYWGVFDVHRQPKFPFAESIVRVPGWQVLAAISILSSVILFGIFCLNSQALKTKGNSLLALVASVTATVTVWIVYDYSQQYLTLASVTVGVLLAVGMIGVIIILLTEAHEWAEAHWYTVRRRQQKPVVLQQDGKVPKISIHVPAYNEPADMMIDTLNALANLNYPDFEVLVIDNNTRDEAVWRPVEAHCALLGDRFRFFHVAPLAGFKAGALNFALRHTCPDASIIAAIDSDYQVDPDWLCDMAGAFDNPRIAIVQSPQDYRDFNDNAFKAMCFAEYRGFFEIGMITRNERNAIIQHGTMTLVRRSVLDTLGGWGEWCITEDAELGLRILEAGYESMYLPCSYGRGLMPNTFIDYKKQRFRWAYGAMQIMRRHTVELFGRHSHLTKGQRYHFLAGWLPWIADGFNLIFNLAAIAWSITMILSPSQVNPPLIMFSILPLSLFVFKLSKMVYLYRSRVKANIRQTIAAAVAGLALSHTVGLATLKGMFTDNMPFVRTPKCVAPSVAIQALVAVREELLMLLSLVLVVLTLMFMPREFGSPDLRVWCLVLLIQALPYAASVAVSFVSVLSWPASRIGGGIRRHVYRPQVKLAGQN